MDWVQWTLIGAFVLSVLFRIFGGQSAEDKKRAEVGPGPADDPPNPKGRAGNNDTEVPQPSPKSAEPTTPTEADTVDAQRDPLVADALRAVAIVSQEEKRFRSAGGEPGFLTSIRVGRAEDAAREVASARYTDPPDRVETLARKAIAASDRAAKSLEIDRRNNPEAAAEERALIAKDAAKVAKREWEAVKAATGEPVAHNPAALAAKEAAKSAKKTAKAARRKADEQKRRAEIRRVKEAARNAVEDAARDKRGVSFGGVIIAIIVALLFVFVVLPLGGLVACGAVLVELLNDLARG